MAFPSSLPVASGTSCQILTAWLVKIEGFWITCHVSVASPGLQASLQTALTSAHLPATVEVPRHCCHSVTTKIQPKLRQRRICKLKSGVYRAAKVVATPPETFRESRWRPAELLLAFPFPDRNLKTPIQPIGHVTGICLRYCHCNLQSKNLLRRCGGLVMMIYGICQGLVIAETVYKNHIWACISSIIWITLPNWHPLDALPSFPIVARHQFGWPVDIVQPPPEETGWI